MMKSDHASSWCVRRLLARMSGFRCSTNEQLTMWSTECHLLTIDQLAYINPSCQSTITDPLGCLLNVLIRSALTVNARQNNTFNKQPMVIWCSAGRTGLCKRADLQTDSLSGLCVTWLRVVMICATFLYGAPSAFFVTVSLPGEPKKIPPTTFVDITAMHGNFCTKFYTIVKRSNIHFITKFYWNISGIDKATQF